MDKKDVINKIFEYNNIYASKGITKAYSKLWLLRVFNKGLLEYVEKDGILLAWICGYEFKNYPEYICMAIVGVNPSFTREGYGIEVVTRFLKKIKDKIVVLNVKKDNYKALRFYLSLGFKMSSVTEDKILMSK